LDAESGSWIAGGRFTNEVGEPEREHGTEGKRKKLLVTSEAMPGKKEAFGIHPKANRHRGEPYHLSSGSIVTLNAALNELILNEAPQQITTRNHDIVICAEISITMRNCIAFKMPQVLDSWWICFSFFSGVHFQDLTACQESPRPPAIRSCALFD
jgi:hypothetical protein